MPHLQNELRIRTVLRLRACHSLYSLGNCFHRSGNPFLKLLFTIYLAYLLMSMTNLTEGSLRLYSDIQFKLIAKIILTSILKVIKNQNLGLTCKIWFLEDISYVETFCMLRHFFLGQGFSTMNHHRYPWMAYQW